MYIMIGITYSIKDVAERLVVSEETVRRWCRTKKINTIRTHRKTGYVIDQIAIEHFLEKNAKYKTIWLSRGGKIYGEELREYFRGRIC